MVGIIRASSLPSATRTLMRVRRRSRRSMLRGLLLQIREVANLVIVDWVEHPT